MRLISKIMERILNNRHLSPFSTICHLKTINLLQSTQAGFHPYRCTIDHIIISLENDILAGFTNKLPTYAVFFDIVNAFHLTQLTAFYTNSVNWESMGISLKWIKSFLKGRTAKF
jgi:hypothetical protein